MIRRAEGALDLSRLERRSKNESMPFSRSEVHGLKMMVESMNVRLNRV